MVAFDPPTPGHSRAPLPGSTYPCFTQRIHPPLNGGLQTAPHSVASGGLRPPTQWTVDNSGGLRPPLSGQWGPPAPHSVDSGQQWTTWFLLMHNKRRLSDQNTDTPRPHAPPRVMARWPPPLRAMVVLGGPQERWSRPRSRSLALTLARKVRFKQRRARLKSQTKTLIRRASTAPPRDGALLATTTQSNGGARGASDAPFTADLATQCATSSARKSG